MKIVLASASERRKELLKRIVDKFEIKISDFNEEKIRFQGECPKYVMEIAKGKVLNIVKDISEDAIVIGCDTVVYFQGNVLGKPKNEKDAFQMIKKLSGNVHNVYSGMAIFNTVSKELICDYSCTQVKFCNISDSEIERYVKTGEPMDKAGAYGIQGYASIFVEKINGCYYNVVGLPLNKLYIILKEMGVNL